MPEIFIMELAEFDISKRQAIISMELDIDTMIDWVAIKHARSIANNG